MIGWLTKMQITSVNRFPFMKDSVSEKTALWKLEGEWAGKP
jgi:hypothetical protein